MSLFSFLGRPFRNRDFYDKANRYFIRKGSETAQEFGLRKCIEKNGLNQADLVQSQANEVAETLLEVAEQLAYKVIEDAKTLAHGVALELTTRAELIKNCLSQNVLTDLPPGISHLDLTKRSIEMSERLAGETARSVLLEAKETAGIVKQVAKTLAGETALGVKDAADAARINVDELTLTAKNLFRNLVVAKKEAIKAIEITKDAATAQMNASSDSGVTEAGRLYQGALDYESLCRANVKVAQEAANNFGYPFVTGPGTAFPDLPGIVIGDWRSVHVPFVEIPGNNYISSFPLSGSLGTSFGGNSLGGAGVAFPPLPPPSPPSPPSVWPDVLQVAVLVGIVTLIGIAFFKRGSFFPPVVTGVGEVKLEFPPSNLDSPSVISPSPGQISPEAIALSMTTTNIIPAVILGVLVLGGVGLISFHYFKSQSKNQLPLVDKKEPQDLIVPSDSNLVIDVLPETLPL